MNKIYKILLIMLSAVSLATGLSAQSSYVFSPTIGQYTNTESGTISASRINYSACCNAAGSMDWQKGHVKVGVFQFSSSGQLTIRVAKTSGYYSYGNTFKIFIRDSWTGDIVKCQQFTITSTTQDYVTLTMPIPWQNYGNSIRSLRVFLRTNDGTYNFYAGEIRIACIQEEEPDPNSSCNCPNNVTQLTASSGTFDDGCPNGEYANNCEALYLLQPADASSITLSFTELDLETNYDFLYIYDGPSTNAPLLAELTGNDIPTPISSSGGSMLVKFESDYSVSYQGFSAIYTSETTPGCLCQAHTNLSSPSASINDGSGAAGDYLNNTDCQWHIHVPGADHFIIEFTELQTESGYDQVGIFAGGSISSPLVTSVSGLTIPAPILVPGDQVTIRFVTDGSVVTDGWTLHYEASMLPLGCSWTDCSSNDCGDGIIFNSGQLHEAVSYLCAHNIIDDGNNGNLLRPEDPISRAELCKITLLALYDGYPNIPEFFPSDFYPSVYIDLQDSTTFYYRFAKALLYLQYNDDTTPFDRNRACFDPAGEVSRNMILKVLLQTYDISPSSPSGSNPFTDFNPDQPGWGYAKRAYELEITTETEFRPYSVCTRAEAFMFLYRILTNPNISIPVPTSSDWYVPNNLSPETLDALKSIEKGSFEYYEKSCLHVEGYIPLDFAIMYESYLTDLPSDLSPLKPMGKNTAWTHSFNSYINVIENPYTHDEYLILHLGTDGIYMYKKAANSASIERLTDGDYNVLEPDGANAYSLTTPDQMVYIFTKLNEKAIFYLTALKNRFNDQISLSYSNAVKPGFKRLNSVSDGVSTLNFTYKPGTDFVASVTDPIRTVSFDYNADSVLMSYTNAKGGVTMFSHGTLPENENLLLSITLPKGNVISNEYSNRLLIASTQVGTASSYTSNVIPNVAISHDINYATGSYTSNVTTGGITTHYVMNSKGRTIHRYGGGVDETYTYSQQHPTLPAQITNNLTSESYLYTYNTSGLTTSETHTGGGLTAQKTWTHNSTNDVTTYTDPDENTCHYSYTNGALTRAISGGGDTVIYVNDSHGLPSRVTANGVVTNYTLNNMGLVTSMSVPAENLSKSFSYDEVGRLTEAIDQSGLSKIWAYDPNDNVISETTPAGVTLMSWDANGNLISVTDALGKTTTIAYNDVDLPTSQSFGGFTREWSWHPDGLLQSVTRPDGQVLNYSYNIDRQLINDGYASYDYTAGRCSSVTKNCKTIQITHDELGRISSISFDGKVVSYMRNLSGRITAITYPDNKTVNYQRNGDGLVTAVTDWMGRVTSLEYNHGKLSKIQLPNGVETELLYDAAGRQTGLHTKRADNSVICSYTFSLDPNGNHTSETVIPYIAFPHPEAGVTNYSYNFNRITTSVGSVGSVYQHDANGNVILAGNTAMTYDLRNHLTSVVNDSTNSVFEYDGYGNRRIATRNGVIMKYVLDLENNANVLMETDVAGNVLNYYVYADDILLYRIKSNGSVHYYLYDYRGSTVALIDADGEVTNRYAYDEYGKLVYQQDSTDRNPFLYCGAYGVMREGELYYMRARYYDPTNRFLSEDGIWNTNLYTYCSNNPISYHDPTGLRQKDPWGRTDNWCVFKHSNNIIGKEILNNVKTYSKKGALYAGASVALVSVGAAVLGVVIDNPEISLFSLGGGLMLTVSAAANGAIAGYEVGFLTGTIRGIRSAIKNRFKTRNMCTNYEL